MQFLPDGTVRIQNSATKEQKVVKPDELPNYGISYQRYQDEYNAYNEMQGGAPATIRNEQAKEKLKTTLSAESARSVLDVLNKKSTGELTGSMADAALQGAVSDYNSKRAFGEGGKNVTDIERQMLGGQLININVVKPSAPERLWGWATGTQKATTSKVAEDEQSIKNKMIQAILRADPNADVSGYTTTPTQKTTTTGGKETFNPNIVEDVLNNAADIVKGLPSIAKVGYALSPSGQISGMLSGNYDPLQPAKIVMDIGKGLIQNLGETTGISYDNEGKFHFSPRDAFVHDYNHPIDTALWVLPFLKGIKGIKGSGILGQAAKDVESANVLDNVLKSGEITKKLPNLAGTAATGVAVPIPESVIKSEELMSKALQNTKSVTYRGMAKELENSISVEGKVIANRALALDATIGSQPLDEVINQVMTKVADTASAKANPNLVKVIEGDLRKELTTGELPGGMATGNIEATNISNMNKARMYMTSSLNSWFNNGQPVGTPTNDLNALRWSAANGLKDIIGEADKEGIIKNSLDKQHVAFQTYPVFSKEALKASPGVSSIGYKWGLIRKFWDMTGAKAIEPIKIGVARALQGKAELPSIEASPTTQVPSIPNQSLPVINSTRPFPLPQDIVDKVFQAKGPAQSERLRTLQDELLKQASMKKYK